MEDYREFTGKNLDEAMAAACAYFGLERGKLEIEIISDAKSGIFGLVGAKKASVRARKANLDILNLKVGVKESEKKPQAENAWPRKEKAAHPEPEAESPARAAEKPAADGAKAHGAAQRARSEIMAQPEGKARNGGAHGRDKHDKNARQRQDRPKAPRPDSPAQQGAQGANGLARPGGSADGAKAHGAAQRAKSEIMAQPQVLAGEDKFPEIPLESMDPALLKAEVLGVVEAMTRHIVGETGKEFEISGNKARVRIDSDEDSGLLIGRDGQTLSALQYLASCIVSRRLNTLVRVQIDAGDYHGRQLEKLRGSIAELTEKVKASGRPQSTRPMSAYLRRIVHMALQDDPDVQTHSTGEGSLKRVVIVPRKK